MPRTKSAASASATKRGSSEKKTIVRTLRPKKKVKSVLVDVIEDEEINGQPDWFEASQDKSEAPEEANMPVSHGRHPEANDDIDKQKKFFSDLVSEIKTRGGQENKKDKKADPESSRRSVILYRRLAIKFFILVGLLAVVVAYFSFSKLTVTISLKGEPLSDNILLKVSDKSGTAAAATSSALVAQDDPRQEVQGQIKEISSSVSKTYPASGETYLGEEVSGQVRVINNYNKSQALVATTRILSPDNKLFRLKNAVTVPAGGEVVVDVYTEKPSEEMAVGPTKFTIPGLWLGLQDKIYAQNDSAFIFNKKVKRYVTSSDLEKAAKDINEALAKAAKDEAGAGLTANNWLYYTPDAAVVTMGAKVGDQVEEFTAKASGKLVAVSFSKDQAAQIAAAKLNLIIPDDKELTEFKPENISYSLDNYDPISRSATIKSSFSGTMVLKSDATVIDPAQLVNLTDIQIGAYLKDQPEIKDYKLSFSPSFIKKAPSLVDRIKIRISKD
jgi:hypothetical protein